MGQKGGAMKRPGKSSKAFSAGGLVVLLVFAFAGHAFGNQNPRFAYVANQCGNVSCTGSGNVSAYTIDSATGALTMVPGSPFAAGSLPFSVAVDPSGKFAYVANAISNNVSAYSIDSTTGVLSPVPGSPFSAGLFPVSVAVDPSGKFAYVANQFSSNVSAYSIDSTTGALSPVPGSAFAAGSNPFSVAVDPSGKFAYVANQLSSNVSAYSIDSTTGALSPVPGSPFASGPSPVSVAVDPSGKFAYVVNQGFSNVSAYSIDSTMGALSPVPGSPFASGFFPLSVAIAGEAVASPAELITNLINTVNSLNLQPGIANSLDAKLQAAQASLAANHTITTCNEMNAFIHEVMAQSGKELTVAQADQLIAQANFIKTGLGCP